MRRLCRDSGVHSKNDIVPLMKTVMYAAGHIVVVTNCFELCYRPCDEDVL